MAAVWTKRVGRRAILSDDVAEPCACLMEVGRRRDEREGGWGWGDRAAHSRDDASSGHFIYTSQDESTISSPISQVPSSLVSALVQGIESYIIEQHRSSLLQMTVCSLQRSSRPSSKTERHPAPSFGRRTQAHAAGL